MIKVIGASPDRVLLKDLGDVIYYKQEKVFSDSQYERSRELRREIKQGHLVIVQKSEDKNSLPEESHSISSEEPEKEKVPTPSDVDLSSLIAKIENLEKKLNEKDPPKREESSGLDASLVNKIVDKLQEFEERLNKKESEPEDNSVLIAVKSLEEKLSTANDNKALLDKIDQLVSRGVSISGHPMVKKQDASKDEVYVPNVTVEDANSHIKLKVRTIEKSDDIESAARALREMRK